jgi:hypothetical protein
LQLKQKKKNHDWHEVAELPDEVTTLPESLQALRTDSADSPRVKMTNLGFCQDFRFFEHGEPPFPKLTRTFEKP